MSVPINMQSNTRGRKKIRCLLAYFNFFLFYTRSLKRKQIFSYRGRQNDHACGPCGYFFAAARFPEGGLGRLKARPSSSNAATCRKNTKTGAFAHAETETASKAFGQLPERTPCRGIYLSFVRIRE